MPRVEGRLADCRRRARWVVIPVALGLVAAASFQEGRRPGQPSIVEAAPSEEPSSGPSSAAEVEGATAVLTDGSGKDQLHVFAEREVGAGHVTVNAVWIGACHRRLVAPGSYTIDCPIVWEEERRVPDDAFHVAPTLRAASLRTRTRGRVLHLRWRATAPTEMSDRPDQPFMVEWNRARVAGRFGRWRVGWQAQPEFSLYRRTYRSAG